MTGERAAVEGVRIARVSRDQVDEAAEILAEAFAEETFFSYLLGGQRDRRVRALRPFFRSVIVSLLPFGEVHSALLDDRLVGVGVRVPPGYYPLRGRRLLQVLRHQIPGIIRMIMLCPRGRRIVSAGRAIEAGQPSGRPYWYLMYVAVDPAYRRRGIATRLAREVLDRADADGVGCYFETMGEGTVALYRKLGFEVIDEGRPLPGGPMGWRLWREPGQAG